MIQIHITKACAHLCSPPELLTAGMAKAVSVEFAFSSDWDGLTKTAVFTNGRATIDVLPAKWDGDTVTVPPEILAVAGGYARVGVYGTNASGVVLPTVWVSLGKVQSAVEPSGDPSADPTLPVWAQLQKQIGDLNDLKTYSKDNLVAAINEARQAGGGGGGGGISSAQIDEIRVLTKSDYDALDAEDSAIDAPDDVTQQRRRKRRLRLLILCLLALVLLVAAPHLWHRAEQLLYPRKYEQLVDQWAQTYNLDPLLVDAFIRTESGFDSAATSSVDARGLMQMTEETFLWLRSKIAADEDLAFADLYDPDTSIRFGCCYLHLCLERYNGDVATAAAAYHSGWGTVDNLLRMEEHSADGQTLQGFPYSQMNHYVNKITSCYGAYQRIYAGN